MFQCNMREAMFLKMFLIQKKKTETCVDHAKYPRDEGEWDRILAFWNSWFSRLDIMDYKFNHNVKSDMQWCWRLGG